MVGMAQAVGLVHDSNNRDVIHIESDSATLNPSTPQRLATVKI